jgi:hypothetical protein
MMRMRSKENQRIDGAKTECCGMLHSAVLTENNQVAIWGKHILRPTTDEPNKKALDLIPSI